MTYFRSYCRSADSKKAHAAGGVVAVDSTFAPPPIQVSSLSAFGAVSCLRPSRAQDPFKWGADIVMHSATKYFGGRKLASRF